MTKQEKENLKTLYSVFCGELFHAKKFRTGSEIALKFNREDPHLLLLKMRFELDRTVEKGSDFTRALSICRWIFSNIPHRGNFSLTDPRDMNACALLELSEKNGGLNCAAKAKILTECCLALWIPARRVGLNPSSPYDTDSHVVAEIFDRENRKWMMLDPTSGGYFSDGGLPLSCLEIRSRFADMGRETVVLPNQKEKDIDLLFEKNLAWNEYYAKNFYFLSTETVSGYGVGKGDSVYLAPRGFDLALHMKRNAEYLLSQAKEERWGDKAISDLEEHLKNTQKFHPKFISEKSWNCDPESEIGRRSEPSLRQRAKRKSDF